MCCSLKPCMQHELDSRRGATLFGAKWICFSHCQDSQQVHTVTDCLHPTPISTLLSIALQCSLDLIPVASLMMADSICYMSLALWGTPQRDSTGEKVRVKNEMIVGGSGRNQSVINTVWRDSGSWPTPSTASAGAAERNTIDTNLFLRSHYHCFVTGG